MNHLKKESSLENKKFSKKNLNTSIPSIKTVDQGTGLVPPFDLKINFITNSKLKKEIINLKTIRGTIFQSNEIDRNFNPKKTFVNKRFRKVWKWIQASPINNENVIFPTDIVLIKLTNEDYFVIEGLRRIVCLKHSKIKSITAFVLDYRDSFNQISSTRKALDELKQ